MDGSKLAGRKAAYRQANSIAAILAAPTMRFAHALRGIRKGRPRDADGVAVKQVSERAARERGPVYLVGWSYGAHIAYEAARARPDLTRKLVLVEAPLDSLMATTDTNTNAVRIERAEATAKYLVRGDVDGGLNYSIDAINGAGAWAATPENFRQLLRDNAWTVVGIGREEAARVTCAEFGSLKMPVLLVQGELTALSSARRLRGSLKRSWRDRSRRTE